MRNKLFLIFCFLQLLAACSEEDEIKKSAFDALNKDSIEFPEPILPDIDKTEISGLEENTELENNKESPEQENQKTNTQLNNTSVSIETLKQTIEGASEKAIADLSPVAEEITALDDEIQGACPRTSSRLAGEIWRASLFMVNGANSMPV